MIVSIPADFSENLISGAGENPDRAVVDIVLNDANGYLMELLAASAQDELEAAIDRAAVGAYFESVFANLDTIKTEVLAASSTATQLGTTSTAALTGMTELSTAISTSKQSSSQLVSSLADAKASSTQLVTGLAGAKSESTALVLRVVHPGDQCLVSSSSGSGWRDLRQPVHRQQHHAGAQRRRFRRRHSRTGFQQPRNALAATSTPSPTTWTPRPIHRPPLQPRSRR